MHTVPVSGAGDGDYVTLVTRVDDDVKRTVADAADLTFLGRALPAGLAPPGDRRAVSLWTAPLFRVAATMEAATGHALELVNGCHDDDDVTPAAGERMSMADVVRRKNVVAMLEYRERLYEQIKSTN